MIKIRRADLSNQDDISAKTYAAFTPYQKGSYCAAQKTVNAQRIAKCRSKKNQAKEPITLKEESL